MAQPYENGPAADPPDDTTFLPPVWRNVSSTNTGGTPEGDIPDIPPRVAATVPGDLRPLLLPDQGRLLRSPFCSSQLFHQRAIAVLDNLGQAHDPAAATGRGGR